MKLNDLQKEIARLVVEGKSNKEIGEELGYSVENIKKNLRVCFKYFKVNDRVGLTREYLLMAYYDLNS